MPDYRALTEPAELLAFFDDLQDRADAGELLGLDTETTGINRWKDEIVGLSISPRMGSAVYIPLRHEHGGNAPDHLVREKFLRPLIEAKWALHNATFDLPIISRWIGCDPWEITVSHDTHLMAQVLGERSEAGSDLSAGLKPLAEKYLGVERPAYSDLFPPKAKKADRVFSKLDVDIATPYAAADADDTLCLVPALYPQILTWGLMNTYELELRLLPEMLWMCARGVLVDDDYAEERSHACVRFAEEVEHAIFEAFTERLGRPVNFNLNSGPQLAAHLYDEAPDGLGLPVLKKTASGNRSVDAETLGKLAAQEPLVAWIVEMRQALKAKGTYFAPFPEHASETDEGLVLHPNYAQNGTETGRMSSQKPNVQNLPKGQVINGADSKTGESLVPGVGELQVNARDMIVARPDHYLVDMDWSQVEYRVIGGMSGDPALLQVFRDGIDLHVNTYAQMNGVDPSTVTKAQRAEGKTLNYALNFGAGPHRLAGMLNCSIGEAKQKIALYKQAFPHVADMKARIEEQARTKRWVNTVFGRKRWLNFGGENVDPDAANKAFHAALREAVNMPVQGTAADLLKITLVRLGPWLRDTYPGAHTLATTHDSITFEVPSSVPPEEFIAAVTPLCEFPEDFIAGYPAITCDFEVGDRWGSLSEMDASTSTPATSTTEDDVPEELPQTIRLGIHGTPSPSSIAAAGDLIRSMGSGPNRLVLQIGTSEFNDEHVVENTALGPNDGHLFAHLFDDYEYRPLGWEMAKATEGAA